MIKVLTLTMVSISLLSATTINELINSGLANNTIIKKNKLQIELIEAKKKESRAKKFGEVDIVGSYTHYNLPRTLAPIVPSAISPNSSIETTQDLFTTAIQYTVPLFTGGALEQQITIDKLSKTIFKIRAKLSREELIYNIRSLYLSGLSLQRLISSQNGYIEALINLKDIISKGVKFGKKAKIDLIKAESAIEDAKGKLTQMESSLKMVKSTLIASTHIDHIDYLEPISVDINQNGIDSINEENLNNLNRFKLQDLEISKGDKIISKVKASKKPQVALNSYFGYNYDIDNSLNQERLWQVGVNLKWNIFDFKLTSAKIEQAKIAKLQAVVQKEEVTESFKKLLAKAINKIETAIANYNSYSSNLNLLHESQKIEEARYSAGVATLNDLLLAKAKTELTKSKLIESQYQYQNGVYYLDYLLEKGEER